MLLQGTGADLETFELFRQAIYQGTTDLALGGPATSVAAAVQTVQNTFPGAEVQGSIAPVQPAVTAPPPVHQPSPAYAQAPAAPGQGDGGLVVNFGKYRGETIAGIFAKDPGYGDFLADKSNNEYVKTRAAAYRASLQAA